jgi:hypothetical protein
MTFHTPKWTPILGVGLPMDSQIFKGRLQGQNSVNWSAFYIIRNLFECRCLKWACMTHLDNWNISYGQKNSQESNWQFDSRPLKVRNRPDFIMWRWCATYRWKVLDKGYNFALDFISIEDLHTKLWAPKVAKISTLGISGLSLPKTKSHLDAGPVANHKVYYKGKGGGFP